MREVAATKPFGDDLKWVEVIANLKRVLGRELTLRSLKDRVDLLIGYWRREDPRNLRKSGTEEQYAEKEQILQDLSDYVRSINYVPKVAPRSSGSSGRNRSQPAASSLSTPPGRVRADEVLPGQHAAQLLLSMTDPCRPAAVDVTGEQCHEEEEEQSQAQQQQQQEWQHEQQQQHHQQQERQHQQQQQEQQQLQQQPQPPSAPRQLVPVMASRGIRGLQSMGLQLLTMRETHEFNLRQKELEIEERKLAVEERRLAHEERKLALAEKKA